MAGTGRTMWARRLTGLALVLSLGAVAAALIGALGSGQELWHFRVGFTFLRWALYAAIAGGLLAIVAFGLSRGTPAKTGGRNLLALLVSLGFLAYLGSHIATARSVPGIHDIATNLDHPPEFVTLKIREDNLEKVPDEGDPALAAMTPLDRWKALHRRAYGDIKPVRVNLSPAEVIRKAEQLARDRGWEIAHVDPEAGVMEATDTTFFFRFKDDVVVRATADPVKGGSRVEMRSISRVGGSDVGVNADRIRSFLEDLQQS